MIAAIPNDLKKKKFYDGKKDFWRTNTSITLSFHECHNSQLKLHNGQVISSYIEIIAITTPSDIEAPHLYISFEKLLVAISGTAISSVRGMISRRSGAVNNDFRSQPAFNSTEMYVGASLFTLDLMSKYLFDRIIVPTLTTSTFNIQLAPLGDDKVLKNGHLDIEIVLEKEGEDAWTNPELTEFQRRTNRFLQSAAEFNTSYRNARDHSIACLKSLRHINVLSGTPIGGERRRRGAPHGTERDSRFGSLVDSSLVETEFAFSSIQEKSAAKLCGNKTLNLEKDAMIDSGFDVNSTKCLVDAKLKGEILISRDAAPPRSSDKDLDSTGIFPLLLPVFQQHSGGKQRYDIIQHEKKVAGKESAHGFGDEKKKFFRHGSKEFQKIQYMPFLPTMANTLHTRQLTS